MVSVISVKKRIRARIKAKRMTDAAGDITKATQGLLSFGAPAAVAAGTAIAANAVEAAINGTGKRKRRTKAEIEADKQKKQEEQARKKAEQEQKKREKAEADARKKLEQEQKKKEKAEADARKSSRKEA